MKKSPEKKEEGVTFDMYHFFSRKDVLFVAVLVVALLLYFVTRALFMPQGA